MCTNSKHRQGTELIHLSHVDQLFFSPDVTVPRKLFSKRWVDPNLRSLKRREIMRPPPTWFGRDWSVGLRPCGLWGGDLGTTNQWGCTNLKPGYNQPSKNQSTLVEQTNQPTWVQLISGCTNFKSGYNQPSNNQSSFVQQTNPGKTSTLL